MQKELVCKAYDFSLDVNNNLIMNFYNVYEEKKLCNGKFRTFREFQLTESLLVNRNTIRYIGYYRDNDYLSVNELSSYNEMESENADFLTKVRLNLLAVEHQVIERIYNPYEVDNSNVNVIAKYVRLINVYSGEQSVLYIGCVPFSEENINSLEEDGFKNIQDSVLIEEDLSMTRKRKKLETKFF